VIQWATGSVGHEALRAVLAHPQLELAAVRVYSADKEGRDAGELCGVAPTGVRASQDAAGLLATPADCVLYMPRTADLGEVCALLASGKNVVATPFLFYGDAYPEADRAQLERACAEGKSSVHGTGIHPGLVGTVLPLALSGISRRIEKLTISERANWTYYNSPRITFDNMRFGAPPERATLAANPFARFNSQLFAQQVWLLARGLRARLDEVTESQELVTAPAGFDVRGGRIEAGTGVGAALSLVRRVGGSDTDRDRGALDARHRLSRDVAAPARRLDDPDRGRAVGAAALRVARELRAP
jgi:hypothetical protein